MKSRIARIPTVLEQKLFGTPIRYVSNHIILDENNVGSFLGPLASKYSYNEDFRNRLDELFSAAKRSNNRFFVLEGTICRAAGSNVEHCFPYMNDTRVLVEVL